MVPIIKYRGGFQPSAGYLPYVPKKHAKYGHHLFVMPKNELHGRVGQIYPGAPGVGEKKDKCEQKAEIFRAQYPERYTEEANT